MSNRTHQVGPQDRKSNLQNRLSTRFGYPVFTHTHSKREKSTSQVWAVNLFFQAFSYLTGKHAGIDISNAVSYCIGIEDSLRAAGFTSEADNLQLLINEVWFKQGWL